MLLDFLNQVPDHRRAQARRYKLRDILFVTILAILSGADSYRDIIRFIQGKSKELKKIFGIIYKKIPSRTNVMKIFNGMDASGLEKIFRNYSNELSQIKMENSENAKRIAIDGKALKGSFDHLKGTPILQLLSVFCANNQLILGHVEIPEKTNEIPTAQVIIEELGLPAGSIYTLDAIHCQKKHLKQLKKQKEN
jgi:hypothetical protein